MPIDEVVSPEAVPSEAAPEADPGKDIAVEDDSIDVDAIAEDLERTCDDGADSGAA